MVGWRQGSGGWDGGRDQEGVMEAGIRRVGWRQGSGWGGWDQSRIRLAV